MPRAQLPEPVGLGPVLALFQSYLGAMPATGSAPSTP